jgi:hypothetical protein
LGAGALFTRILEKSAPAPKAEAKTSG